MTVPSSNDREYSTVGRLIVIVSLAMLWIIDTPPARRARAGPPSVSRGVDVAFRTKAERLRKVVYRRPRADLTLT